MFQDLARAQLLPTYIQIDRNSELLQFPNRPFFSWVSARVFVLGIFSLLLFLKRPNESTISFTASPQKSLLWHSNFEWDAAVRTKKKLPSCPLKVHRKSLTRKINRRKNIEILLMCTWETSYWRFKDTGEIVQFYA